MSSEKDFLEDNDDLVESNNSLDYEQKLGIIPAADILPKTLFCIPLHKRPLFPEMIVPIVYTSEKYVETIAKAYKSEYKVIGLLLSKIDDEENEEDLRFKDLYKIGVVARIRQVIEIDTNKIQVFFESLRRFIVVQPIQEDPYLIASVDYHYPTSMEINDELKAYSMAVISALKELMSLNPIFKEELNIFISRTNINEPGRLADFAAAFTSSKKEELQSVLETFNVRERIDKVLVLLKKEIDLVKLQQKISKQIEEKISEQQRQFFLKEQLKAIKEELGLTKDEKSQEIEKFRKRMNELKLSEECKKVVEEELQKLSLLEVSSPEFNVSRNYLDWLTSLPWGIYSEDNYDIDKARKILDADHYGLEDIKERILEFISVAKLKNSMKGSIICLSGPPGVGKTSVGKSIAKALNRQFFRFSVGGMRDEAEIKGHRRTYIGAMPGKLIQALKLVKTSNPVIMIDEIDKLSISYQGDPASALLEVLDPEQNTEFLDHYLDVRYDLSDVLFITTANVLENIPRPLLDRMEVMTLSGYTTEEKKEIAKKYLIPKNIESHGLSNFDIKFTDSAIKDIIEGYAREAGVRNLEKLIKKILRKVAMEMIENKLTKVTIKTEDIEKYLGHKYFDKENIFKKPEVGVVTGLAWTGMGGSVLYIEAVKINTEKRGFKQTGQLGNVMLESSEIAYSYASSLIEKYGGDKNYFDKSFIHLHVPAGATPKDGPSAGITIVTALLSLALNKPVRNTIAMTGEITLTGKVLPIGGLKEKMLAARRSKIKEVIIPKANEPDYNELPDYIKKDIKIYFVETYPEVYKIVFKSK